MKRKSLLKLFLVLFFSILFINCSNPESKVTRVVNKFYSEYQHDFREVNKRYITHNLYELIIKAEQIEEEDEILVKNSAYPTDKPLLIEGDIFTSLYEGHTSFTVKKINIVGDKANVVVVFENKKYDEIWEDEVLLVKEKNRWKIDNVLFKKESNTFGSTQQYLKQFINYSFELNRKSTY